MPKEEVYRDPRHVSSFVASRDVCCVGISTMKLSFQQRILGIKVKDYSTLLLNIGTGYNYILPIANA